MKKTKLLISILLSSLLTTGIVLAATLPYSSNGQTLTKTVWDNVISQVNENTNKLLSNSDSISTNSSNILLNTNKLDGVYNVGGNIGIGIENTIWKLDVNGLDSSGVARFISNNKSRVLNETNDDIDGTAVYALKTPSQQWNISTSSIDGGAGEGDFFIQDISNGFTSLLIENTTGNVGIGHVQPTQKLQVNGNGLATAWNTTSDIRKKENIVELTGALESIINLNGVRFDWKETGESDVGVIAQEIEKEYPEFVTMGTDGYKSVDYSKLVAPLIEAVKELKDLNEEQQNQIDILKNEINILKNK